MNGFIDHGLDESNFGQTSSLSVVRSFDAFPKTKATYLARSRSGGTWTAVLLLMSALLTLSETRRWWAGTTSHTFSIEKGVSHDLQINLDAVIAMRCDDLRVNVQDASGDRILAGEALRRDPTAWRLWGGDKGVHRLGSGAADDRRSMGWTEDDDVHDFLGAARGRRSFPKTPRLRGPADSCRLYGSLAGNKVQGDFHITARGHGYREFGEHLDHTSFNFSHQVNELSFGPYYPSLENPLDKTYETTSANFFKFQYYLSVVPTIYTTSPSQLGPLDGKAVQTRARNTVFTNQYAVTEQSHPVGEEMVPGIFFKFDIEPITLVIAEEWGGYLGLLVRLVNIVSGIMVAGGWCFQLSEWAGEVWGRRSRRKGSMGVLHGRTFSDEKAALD